MNTRPGTRERSRPRALYRLIDPAHNYCEGRSEKFTPFAHAVLRQLPVHLGFKA